MKPFLKWAGGKRWLTSRYPELFDVPLQRYIEPFLGSGSVFFHLEPQTAILADENGALINLYLCLRSNWKEVHLRLRKHARKHGDEYYYWIRERRYADRFDRAAQLLYLNRTCWNGLYRENLKGEFNVPKGTKNTVLFPDDDFQHAAKLLKRATVVCSDFEEIVLRSKKGDLVFVDPPYTVKHNNNGFIKYNETIFHWDDQVRLAEIIRKRSKSGANFIITNAYHDSLIELYRDIAKVFRLTRASVISGRGDARGQTDEALFLVGPHWSDFDLTQNQRELPLFEHKRSIQEIAV
jgi:DNA adenine methylase